MNDQKPWPEFAEHDCYACHHDLQAEQKRKPGKSADILRWSSWNVSMTHRALAMIRADEKTLAGLSKVLDAGWRNRKEISGAAKKTAKDLSFLIEQLERRLADPVAADKAFREILDKVSVAQKSWDDAVQVALALGAMRHAPTKLSTDLGPGCRVFSTCWNFPRITIVPSRLTERGSLQDRRTQEDRTTKPSSMKKGLSNGDAALDQVSHGGRPGGERADRLWLTSSTPGNPPRHFVQAKDAPKPTPFYYGVKLCRAHGCHSNEKLNFPVKTNDMICDYNEVQI